MNDLQSAIQRALYQAALEGDTSSKITLSERVIELTVKIMSGAECVAQTDRAALHALASADVMAMTPERLRDELDAPYRSQTALAKRLGIDPSAVNRMVNGRRQIKARELPTIAAYLKETSGLVGRAAS